MDFYLGTLFKGVFIPNLPNNQLASCSLIISIFYYHTAHFDKSIILLFLVLTAFGFLLSVFFCTLQVIRQHCFIYSLNLYLLLEF